MREQLEDSSMRYIPQGRKCGCCQNWKKKCQPQHYVDMPFARSITDITCMSPEKIRNGDTL
jgi:hypothetical protein